MDCTLEASVTGRLTVGGGFATLGPMVQGLIDASRRGAWLTEARVVAYSRMLVAAYVVAAVALVATADGLIDVNGKPLGTDFLNVWAAGALALKGQAAAAYDWARHALEESAVFGGAPVPYYGWHYPPPFLLVAAPLALLPYPWALLTWMALTLGGYLAVIARVVPHRHAVLVAAAFTGVFVNLGHGQNGFLSVALLAAGALSLERRPWLAGLVLGLLAYKPQLAVLVPVALVAGGYWRALAGMAVSGLALSALSTLAFGPEIWLAFKASLTLTREIALEEGNTGFYKMTSVFAAARWLGAGIDGAWVAQWLSTVVTAAVVFLVCRRPGSALLKGALVAAAAPLATPYGFDYDLMVLALPIACVAREGLAGEFLPWEPLALALAFALPIVTRNLALHTGLPLAPLVITGLLVVVARRLVRA